MQFRGKHYPPLPTVGIIMMKLPIKPLMVPCTTGIR